MATTSTARTHWQGSLTEGSGKTDLTTSGAASFDMTWGARTEAGSGTNPEELLAAALATCYSMALAHALSGADTPPTSVQELFSRAAAGEGPAVELVEAESQRIAAIAASVCAIVDPETVILTGGVGANTVLVARVRELIEDLAPFPPRSSAPPLGSGPASWAHWR